MKFVWSMVYARHSWLLGCESRHVLSIPISHKDIAIHFRREHNRKLFQETRHTFFHMYTYNNLDVYAAWVQQFCLSGGEKLTSVSDWIHYYFMKKCDLYIFLWYWMWSDSRVKLNPLYSIMFVFMCINHCRFVSNPAQNPIVWRPKTTNSSVLN